MNLDFGQVAFKGLKNIEKIIFFILGAMWIVMSLTLIIKWWAKAGASTAVMDEIKLPEYKEPTEEKDWKQRWQVYVSRLNKPEELVKYNPLLSRNIFAQKVEPPYIEDPIGPNTNVIIPVRTVPLILRDTKAIIFPLMYKGFMELPDRLIAQINWGQKTYLVRESDKIEYYTIEKVTKETIEIVGGSQGKIILEYQKPTTTQEYEGIIYHIEEKKLYERVRKGNKIGGIEVLEVMDGTVKVLFEGKEKILLKSR